MKHQIFSLAVACCALLVAVTEARAVQIQVNYTGTVTSVTPNLSGPFAPGQTLDGTYIFESTTAPLAGSTVNGAVYDAIIQHSFDVFSGGVVYSASTPVVVGGAPEIQIDNAGGGFPNDRYGVLSRASDGLAGPAVNGLPLDSLGFRLDDFSNTVFATALDLPTNLTLADFDSSAFFLFFGITLEGLISGSIDSIDFAVVPEPSTLALLAIGVAVVAGCSRVRRRD